MGAYDFVVRARNAIGEEFSVGTVDIAPAKATVTLGDLNRTYDGTPKAASVATDPSGLAVSVTYDGSPPLRQPWARTPSRPS